MLLCVCCMCVCAHECLSVATQQQQRERVGRRQKGKFLFAKEMKGRNGTPISPPLHIRPSGKGLIGTSPSPDKIGKSCHFASALTVTSGKERRPVYFNNMPLKIGDKLPSVDLFEGDPDTKVKVSDLKGKVVIFGVPGAFTPTCNNDHAPNFIQNVDALKAKGVSDVVCVSVNDPFVMAAWGKALNATGKVKFFADTNAEFVKQADLSVDLSAVLGNVRSKRFAMLAEDGVVKGISVEPDGTGYTCSKPADVMKFL